MPEMEDVIPFQMPEVYVALSFSIDSIPPTRRDSATRATERSSASSISCAPRRLVPRRADSFMGPDSIALFNPPQALRGHGGQRGDSDDDQREHRQCRGHIDEETAPRHVQPEHRRA